MDKNRVDGLIDTIDEEVVELWKHFLTNLIHTTMSENFDLNFQLGNRMVFPGSNISVLNFFRDRRNNQPLSGCTVNLKELLQIIDSQRIDTWDEENENQLYLPLNTREVSIKDIFVLLGEDVIDLSLSEGKVEAKKRFCILAQLLEKQPRGEQLKKGKGLDIFEKTIIGNFKFPDKVIYTISVRWVNSNWRFEKTKCEKKFDPVFWFIFLTKENKTKLYHDCKQ